MYLIDLKTNVIELRNTLRPNVIWQNLNYTNNLACSSILRWQFIVAIQILKDDNIQLHRYMYKHGRLYRLPKISKHRGTYTLYVGRHYGQLVYLLCGKDRDNQMFEV